MKTYTKTIIVTKADLDDLNHVNNVRYIQWGNDIAKAHWHNNATESIINNYFWILLSHNIEYKAPAFIGNELLIKHTSQ